MSDLCFPRFLLLLSLCLRTRTLAFLVSFGPPLSLVQFNMAKLVPGKEEFYETIRYFSRRLDLTGVDVRLNNKVDAPSLLASDPAFDAVILATGVLPRKLSFEGSDHPKVRRDSLV